jgi:hypothetical protein
VFLTGKLKKHPRQRILLFVRELRNGSNGLVKQAGHAVVLEIS